MVTFVSKKEAAVIIVALIALIYQLVFKQIIFGILGISRHVLSIKDFPHVQCEKVVEPGLEGCEDMWLHEKTGFLYMACSDSKSRVGWLPAVGALNSKGRGMNDRLAILDTRGSGSISSRLKFIKPEGFDGINGDGTLNLHGFDIWESGDSPMLRILLVNHRPPIDSKTGNILDNASSTGANSTIEQFLTRVGTDKMKHIKTFYDPLIATPNNVAWVTDHSFLLSNDNGFYKTGIRRPLTMVMGGGNVVYCSRHVCNVAYSKFKGPNGLVRGKDGLIYVPNTLGDTIDVFSLNEKHTLVPFHSIKVPLPIDNLSVDKNGDVFAASLPKVYQWADSARRPFEVNPSSAVLRIKRGGMPENAKGRKGHLASDSKDYWVEEIMEDDGSVLPGSTVAVHDVMTGRFFMGGIMSPFITICETR